MPVFEFRCSTCGKKFAVLLRNPDDPDKGPCPACGGLESKRLVSRFARLRTEDDRIDAVADELEQMGEPESPSEMRNRIREMGKAMDDDMSDEMEAMFESDMESDDPGGAFVD